jgi:hypothetical protein
MLVRKNKRSDERFAARAPIFFSFFSTRFWHEYESTTRNYSRDGMCFESNYPLTRGIDLYIRIGQPAKLDSAIDPDVRMRSSTLAKVVWCRELSDEDAGGYCVGVRYF